jgi:putative ABC transport system substrate-binding protein
VFATGEDPINIGLVPSLNRPEGNVTGIFFYSGTDLQSTQLELLREVVPNTRVMGVLVNPKSPQAEFQATNRTGGRASPRAVDFHFERYQRE